MGIHTKMPQELADRYGHSQSLMALADRIKLLHPAADMLGENGVLQLAQFSLSTGARVFPVGIEIPIYKDINNELVIQLGVEYFRRVGREAGGYFMCEQPRPMNQAERSDHDVPWGALAYQCSVGKFTDLAAFSGISGFDMDMYVTKFATVGKAVVLKDEMNTPAPHGRTWAWMAEKRCEVAALKSAFGVLAEVAQVLPPLPSPSAVSLADINNDLFGN